MKELGSHNFIIYATITLLLVMLQFIPVRAQFKPSSGVGGESSVVTLLHSGSEAQLKRGPLFLNTAGAADSNGLIIKNGLLSINKGATLPTDLQKQKLKILANGNVGASTFCDPADTSTEPCQEIPATFPNPNDFKKIILMFEQNCPPDWKPVPQLAGRYPRGDSVASLLTQGGSAGSHSHTVNRYARGLNGGGSGSNYPSDRTTTNGDLPSYLNVVFCQYAL